MHLQNVINQFSAVAMDDRVRFLGNVRLGTDVSLAELRALYSGVSHGHGQSTLEQFICLALLKVLDL